MMLFKIVTNIFFTVSFLLILFIFYLKIEFYILSFKLKYFLKSHTLKVFNITKNNITYKIETRLFEILP